MYLWELTDEELTELSAAISDNKVLSRLGFAINLEMENRHNKDIAEDSLDAKANKYIEELDKLDRQTTRIERLLSKLYKN